MRSPMCAGAMRALGIKDDNAFAEYLLGGRRRRGGARLRLRRTRPHAPLLRLQHEDPGGCAGRIRRVLTVAVAKRA